MKQVRLTIKDIYTNEIIIDFGIMNEHKASKVERGILRQMNTDKYYLDEEEA